MNRTTELTEAGTPVDFDALWAAAPLPEADRAAWRELTVAVTRSPDEAIRLVAHGWSPAEVDAARGLSGAWWSAASTRSPNDDEAKHVRIVVLADFLARYFDHHAGVARDVRWLGMRELTTPSSGGVPWSPGRIGDLLNISRQRVAAILKGR